MINSVQQKEKGRKERWNEGRKGKKNRGRKEKEIRKKEEKNRKGTGRKINKEKSFMDACLSDNHTNSSISFF